jgi:hypothetical protein
MNATSNRRHFERHAIHVPVSVSTAVRRDRVGVIRDVSASGVLFHSLSQFEVGERVTLMFKVKHRHGSTAGYVVRTDTDEHPDNFFRHLTAVQFDAPLFDLPL